MRSICLLGVQVEPTHDFSFLFMIRVQFYFIFIFLFDPSRSELIRLGLAVRVDSVRLLYLPS